MTWAGLASSHVRRVRVERDAWLLPSAECGAKIRRHARLLNAERETKKVAIGFLSIQIMRSYHQPLLAPHSYLSPLSRSSFCFVAGLWYWQHCMLVVTVCLQGSIKTKWVCSNEVPAHQSKWSESESKESFFLLRSTQAWEPLQQEHQNRCIIVSCIQAPHQLHNSKHI